MEGGLAQHCDSRLWHHVLSAQDLQHCCLASSIAPDEEAPGSPWQGYCHALYHWWNPGEGPAICMSGSLIIRGKILGCLMIEKQAMQK